MSVLEKSGDFALTLTKLVRQKNPFCLSLLPLSPTNMAYMAGFAGMK